MNVISGLRAVRVWAISNLVGAIYGVGLIVHWASVGGNVAGYVILASVVLLLALLPASLFVASVLRRWLRLEKTKAAK